MKKLTLVVIFTMAFAAMGFGQDAAGGDSEYTVVPVNVSLIPGASMSAGAFDKGQKIINNFSLNLLAGHAASLRGFEVGGWWNYYSEDVKGVQIGGLANIVRGEAGAVQVAGITNIVMKDAKGAQIAAILNLDKGDFTGAQVSGALNMVSGKMKGIEIAALGNLTRGDFKGVQISGFTNLHRGNLAGIQIAGILNIAQKVESGFQIGLFNYSKENNGIPIGLVSYVKEDGLRFDVWADEALFTNVGLRSGTRRFHNILFVGKQVTNSLIWTAGVGIGPHFDLSKTFYLEPNLIYQIIGEFSNNWDDNSQMTKIRVLAGWEISKYISIFGGPTLNTFWSKSNDGSEYALLTISESKDGDIWRRMSIGFVLGAKFL